MATESETELRLAIGRHDDLLERVAKMLSYARQTGEIPRHLLLEEEELQALDAFLVSVAAGLTLNNPQKVRRKSMKETPSQHGHPEHPEHPEHA